MDLALPEPSASSRAGVTGADRAADKDDNRWPDDVAVIQALHPAHLDRDEVAEYKKTAARSTRKMMPERPRGGSTR